MSADTATVDSATAQMANTSINEPSANAAGASVGSGGDKPINATSNDAVIQSAAEGRRLYIGNLAYATTEGDLKDFFKDYLIETTSIPTNPRTTRPVGYAFVDLSTPTEAERAVNELNGKSIMDRKVSVQLARKPDEPASAAAINGETAEADSGRKRSSGRGRGRNRGSRRGGRANAGKTGEEGADGATVEPTNVPGQAAPLADTTNAPAATTEATEGGAKPKKQRQPREPREPREPRPARPRGPPEDGVPSKNKVMVANLPYDLKEEKLLEIFAAYQPTGAKLALRPIPRFMVRKLQARGEPRKGRGFAFVTMPSEDLQQKAISEMNGKDVDGRELAVKVAVDSPGKEEDALNAQADAEGENNTPPQASATVEPTAA